MPNTGDPAQQGGDSAHHKQPAAGRGRASFMLGIHALALSPSWESEALAQAIAAAARLGYDLIELPIPAPRAVDTAALRAALAAARIGATCSVSLPRARHLPWAPEQARSWLGQALDAADAIGARFLTGALAYAPGVFSGEPVTLAERFIVAEVLQDLGDEARRRGIWLAFLPANRYETYLANTVADGLDFVSGIDNDALRLHAHTFHMHIEESDLAAALEQAGKALGYVTISESHRGLPGSGLVRWEQVWRGLTAAGYAGPLMFEGFGHVEPDVAARLALWRSDEPDHLTLAKAGLAFLREGTATIARGGTPAEESLPAGPAPVPGKPQPRAAAPRSGSSPKAPARRATGKSYRTR